LVAVAVACEVVTVIPMPTKTLAFVIAAVAIPGATRPVTAVRGVVAVAEHVPGSVRKPREGTEPPERHWATPGGTEGLRSGMGA